MQAANTPAGWTPEMWSAVKSDDAVRDAVLNGGDVKAAMLAAMRRYMAHLEAMVNFPDLRDVEPKIEALMRAVHTAARIDGGEPVHTGGGVDTTGVTADGLRDAAYGAATREMRVTESKRLLDIDAAKRPGDIVYGHRIRCRACLTEEQVNLLGHAEMFLKQHAACGTKPRLS